MNILNNDHQLNPNIPIDNPIDNIDNNFINKKSGLFENQDFFLFDKILLSINDDISNPDENFFISTSSFCHPNFLTIIVSRDLNIIDIKRNKKLSNLFPFLVKDENDKIFFHKSIVSKIQNIVIKSIDKNKSIFYWYDFLDSKYSMVRRYVLHCSKVNSNKVSIFLKDVTRIYNLKNNFKQFKVQCNWYKKALLTSTIISIFDENGTIKCVNDLFCEKFNLAKDNLIGIPRFKLTKSKELNCNQLESIRKILKRDNIWKGELFNKNDRDEQLWTYTTILPFTNEREQKKYFMEISIDITDRKKIEDSLVHSECLINIGTLVASIAHQFNNLHTPIVGYVQLLKSNFDLDMMMTEYLDIIYDHITKSSGLTRSLLEFAKTTDKSVREKVSLEKMVEDILNIIENQLINSKIKIIKDYDQKFSTDTLGEKNELGQVIMNLIINSYHALLDSEEKKIIIKIGEQDKGVFVSIVDTGCGIPKHNLKNIFKPLFTTKGKFARQGSSLEKVKSSGLGLYFCERVIQKYKGKISVESVEGEGAGFIIWLPKLSLNIKKEEKTQKILSQRTNLKILVVDDEESIRNLIKYLLKKHQHEVEDCSNGIEALKLIRKNEYDVVFTDWIMPKMSGEELIENINKLTLPKKPKIIVTTGIINENEFNENIKHSISGMLKKPFKLENLIQVLNENIHKNSFSSENNSFQTNNSQTNNSQTNNSQNNNMQINCSQNNNSKSDNFSTKDFF